MALVLVCVPLSGARPASNQALTVLPSKPMSWLALKPMRLLFRPSVRSCLTVVVWPVLSLFWISPRPTSAIPNTFRLGAADAVVAMAEMPMADPISTQEYFMGSLQGWLAMTQLL